ncbi:hypothetical protein [Rhodobacteraceae bacterium W635]|uniref:hypothetical protein n=1 Tax=Nioella halotolerans TaxID=2303578 RepID=UPI0011C12B9A
MKARNGVYARHTPYRPGNTQHPSDPDRWAWNLTARCGTPRTDRGKFAWKRDGLLLRPSLATDQCPQRGDAMNRIIYIVGFVVIFLIILGFLGLR